MRRTPNRRTAFTMIELIIVIVVLGLLASIGILAYGSVVSTSQDRAASLALTDVAREASALAAQNGETEWSEADFSTALADTAAGPALSGGVSAAAKLALVNAAADSTNSSSVTFGQVSLQTLTGGIAGLAMKTQAGHCVFVRDVLPQQISTWTAAADLGGNCLASVGLTAGPAGSYSYTATVTAGATPLAPTGVTAALVGGNVSVNWNPVDGSAISYTVYRSTDGGAHWSPVLTGLRFAGTADTTATTPGTTYTYAVTATATNESPKSAPAGITLAPAAPAVTASISGTTASLSWAPVPGATAFTVYKDGAATPVTLAATATSWSDPGLPVGSAHSYVVGAANAGGETKTAAVSLTAIPAAPARVNVAWTTPGNPQTTITWPAASGAASYEVTRISTNLATGQVQQIRDLGSTSATGWADGLATGESVVYTVTASNGAGTSAATAAAPIAYTVTPDGAGTDGAAYPSLIADGSFESGTAWTIGKSGVNEVIYSNSQGQGTAYDGTRFMATNTTPALGSGVYDWFGATVTAGGRYCVAARVTSQGGGSSGGTMDLRSTDSTGATINGTDQTVFGFSHLPGNSTWLRVSGCFTATAASSRLVVDVLSPSDGSTLYVDYVHVWKAN